MTDDSRRRGHLPGLTRRDYLEVTGSAALAAALAGCTGPSAGDAERTVAYGYGGDALSVPTMRAAASDPVPSPVARWTLDETTGTVAADAAGDSDGTYVGSPMLDVAGVRGTGSVDFRRSDGNYVRVPDAAALRPTPALSVGAWYRTESGETNQTLVQKSDTLAGGAGYSLEVQTETGVRAHFGTAAGGVTVSSFGHATHDGTWHHLLATWDGAVLVLYLDGEEVARAAGSGDVVHTARDLFVAHGDNGYSSVYDVAGAVDDVRLYDVALPAAAVRAVYDGTATDGDTTTTTTSEPTTTSTTTTTSTSEPTTTSSTTTTPTSTSTTATSTTTTSATDTSTTSSTTTTTTTPADDYGRAGYGDYGYGGTL